MPIFGALGGLTAAGLYAAVDELRVANKIRSHQLSGKVIALTEYMVSDARFEGIIRRFENDWQLDGGTLYPAKLVGFFAENPQARKQWVRMQASILLHDAGMRRSCETDTIQFGDEAAKYELEFGVKERKFIREHYSKARTIIEHIEQERLDDIARNKRIAKRDKILQWVFLTLGMLLIIVFFALFPHYGITTTISSAGVEEYGIPYYVATILLSLGLGSITYGVCLWIQTDIPIVKSILVCLVCVIAGIWAGAI